jgi:precorrin-2 dehydrogenase
MLADFKPVEARRAEHMNHATTGRKRAKLAVLFPLFLKLDTRTCLVVGAGAVAQSKIESLLLAGATVRVVAPQATPGVRTLARRGKLRWKRRVFVPSDLKGVFLVVAAASPEVHEQVYREARRRGVLCNVVDDPPRCDFFYPAVVRRGPLQIAISTSGRSPSLAQFLREQLETRFGPEYAEWVERLGAVRLELLSRPMDPGRRKFLLRRIARLGPRKKVT